MPYSIASTRTLLTWHTSGDIEPLITTVVHQGYEVSAAVGQAAVLVAVLQTLPDMLLISLQASGEDGYALCRLLRSLEITRLLPIVFVGTRSEQSELLKVLRCGGSDYLQMPMNAEECWLRLSRHLQTAQIMRQLQVEKESLNKKVAAYDQMIQQQEAIQETLTAENQNLQRLAFIDGLTQVANRRSFNQTIAQLWQNACQQGQPVSLLMCDIDYFKRYNDTYGHLAGDRCLRSVAGAIVKGAHRHGDYVARYGGEEFAILLPETDSSGAQQVAKAVQAAVLRERIPHRTSLVKPQISLSIGICTLSPDSLETSHEVLIHGADEALYTAKIRGRNLSVTNTYGGLVSVVPSLEPEPISYLPEVGSRWDGAIPQLSGGSEARKLKNLRLVRNREVVSSQ